MVRLVTIICVLLAYAACRTLGQTFNRCDWCGENAECVANSECRCPATYRGHPYFLCYRPDQIDVCQLCDDPSVITDNGDHVSLTYVDSTLLVDKTLKLNRNKICRIRVVVSNKRIRGKSFPNCIYIRVDVKDKEGKVTCSFAYKICAYSKPIGLLLWKIFGGFSWLGGPISVTPWKNIISVYTGTAERNFCDCPAQFHVSKGKILIMKLTCCSFKLGFRQFFKKIVWLKTGIFIITKKTTPKALLPGESVLGFPICLRPGVSTSDVASNLSLPDPEQAMSFLALTNLPPDVIDVDPDLVDMTNALNKCSAGERQNLFNEAGFMMTLAPFIREISGDTNDFSELVTVVTKAAEWYCEGAVASCRYIMDAIEARAQTLLARPAKYPELATFVNGNCTST